MIGVSILFMKTNIEPEKEDHEVDWEALGLKRPKQDKKEDKKEDRKDTFFTVIYIDPFAIVSVEPALNTSDKKLGVNSLIQVPAFDYALKSNEDIHVLVGRINEFKRGEAL